MFACLTIDYVPGYDQITTICASFVCDKEGTYSHLFNKRGAWNKRGGGAKVAKSLNVELGINEEGGIFGKN